MCGPQAATSISRPRRARRLRVINRDYVNLYAASKKLVLSVDISCICSITGNIRKHQVSSGDSERCRVEDDALVKDFTTVAAMLAANPDICQGRAVRPATLYSLHSSPPTIGSGWADRDGCRAGLINSRKGGLRRNERDISAGASAPAGSLGLLRGMVKHSCNRTGSRTP